MRRRKTLLLIFALAVAAGLSLFAGRIDFDAYARSSLDLMTAEKGYFTANAFVPSSAGIPEYRSGLLFTATESGSEAVFTDNMAGAFDLDFMVYSSIAFGGGAFESQTYSNSYQDIAEMSLIFTDKADALNSFRLRLTGGAAGSNVTVNACAETKGTRAGINYYRDSDAAGNTAGQNENGVYTFLWGTSFSNCAVSSGTYAGANVKACGVGFDPVSMQVYGYSHGYNSAEGKRVVIWDFSKSENDGRDIGFTLGGFAEYSVSVKVDSLKKGVKGNILLLSLNGQLLGSTVLVSKAGPRVYAVPGAGKAGERYVIPAPSTYDAVYGKGASYTGRIFVRFESGVQIPVRNAADTDNISGNMYAAGCHFTPSAAGVYTLTYQARNSAGIYGSEAAFKLNVLPGDNEAYFELPDIQKNRQKDSVLTVPACSVKAGGGTHTAVYKVFDPDNAEVTAANVALSKAGRYEIVYSYTLNSETYEKSVSVYSLASAQGLFANVSGSAVSAGESGLHGGLSGIIVSAGMENAQVEYTKTIDLNARGRYDKLIELIALPNKSGSADFGQFTVKLADAQDPSNYVSVVCSASPVTADFDMSYIRAGAAEQRLAGLNRGIPQSSSGEGTPVFHSFSGRAKGVDLTRQTFAVYFDYARKEVCVQGGTTVIGLQNPEHFSNTWRGFATGAVKMSVSVQQVQSETARYLIKSADGIDCEGTLLKDNTPPVVSAGEFDTEAPKGKTGTPYPLPLISCSDNADGAIPYVLKVYRNYGSALFQTEIDVISGAFVPAAAGEYSIVVTAADKSGNKTVKEYSVQAADSVQALTVSVLGSVPSSALAGEKIYLPAASASGGSGRITITVEQGLSGVYSPINGGLFIPSAAGSYTVRYTAEDYLGTKDTKDFPCNVTLSTAPVFQDAPAIPEILISGQAVRFNDYLAIDYHGSGQTVKASAYVSVDGGAETLLPADLSYTPQITAAGAVLTLRYEAKSVSGGTDASKPFNIPVINVRNTNGTLNLSRYFLGSAGIAPTMTADYIDYGTSVNNSEIKFIRTVPSNLFELQFQVPSTSNNFTSADIILTNADGRTVTLSIEKGASGIQTSKFYVNGTYAADIAGNFWSTGISSRYFRIAYNNLNFSIKDYSNLTVATIKFFDDGSRFTGFSREINFAMKFKGVGGNSAIRLLRVCNQPFTNIDDDFIDPMVDLEGALNRTVEIGGTVIVPAAKAYDILSFTAGLSISIQRPDGTFIIQNQPADSERAFKAEVYGNYRVIYRADDGFNSVQTIYQVYVADRTPPDISVSSLPPAAVAADSFIKIQFASCTDNVSGAADITTAIFLIAPDNSIIKVAAGSDCQLTIKGIYILRYFAMDGAGNCAYLDYKIEAR